MRLTTSIDTLPVDDAYLQKQRRASEAFKCCAIAGNADDTLNVLHTRFPIFFTRIRYARCSIAYVCRKSRQRSRRMAHSLRGSDWTDHIVAAPRSLSHWGCGWTVPHGGECICIKTDYVRSHEIPGIASKWSKCRRDLIMCLSIALPSLLPCCSKVLYGSCHVDNNKDRQSEPQSVKAALTQ